MTTALKNLGRLLSMPAYVLGGIDYKLSGFLYTPRPRFVCFPVTFRCNSRCQMCNIWQTPEATKEIGLEKIEEVFSDRLFMKVEEAVLHGGEPTLRKDIKEIYRIITSRWPKLKRIISSTNGLNPEMIRKRVGEILSVVETGNVQLTLTVSIDGMRESHETIRGIKGGFDRTLKTLGILKKFQERYPVEVQIITVIQPQNIHDLEEMNRLARSHDVEIIFQPMMIDTFYSNEPTDPRLRFTEDQLEKYCRFIKNNFIGERTPRSLYWENFLEMLNGGKRRVPCAYDRYVLSMYPTGEVLPCAKEKWMQFGNVNKKPVHEIWYSDRSGRIRKRMRKEACPICHFYCGAEYSLQKEFFTYFGYCMKSAPLLHFLRTK